MDRRHTDREYEGELESLRERVLLMGAHVEEVLSLAMRSYNERNVALARATIELDSNIDQLELEIDEAAIQILARRQPVASDLRFITTTLKLVTDLERIGDLLLSFATSAQAADGRLDSQDCRDLTQMATVLEKMLADVGQSFSQHDVKKAIDVLRADAEMDRLRNIIFLRHIENPENVAHHSSLQVIFMTQSLERAGDHAKNLAEEVCHFVSGRSIRHLLMAYDKPKEQMFIEWLRHKDEKSQ